MNEHADTQTYRQTHRQINRQAYRQTYRHTQGDTQGDILVSVKKLVSLIWLCVSIYTIITNHHIKCI